MKNLLAFSSVILLLLCVSCSEISIEQLINGNEFYFELINSNGNYGGMIYNDHGIWSSNYGSNYTYFNIVSNRVEKNNVYLTYVSTAFNFYGEPSFVEYYYPKYFEMKISKKQIEKRIKSIKDGKMDTNKKIQEISREVFLNTDALVICNNLRIREMPNLNKETKIVGKLNKWDKVTILSPGDEKTTIEDLSYPWYEIQTEDGIKGWVYGGFVKIYFYEEDKELLYKAFEKENSEYTNQFVSSDNS